MYSQQNQYIMERGDVFRIYFKSSFYYDNIMLKFEKITGKKEHQN
ncbi:hypothetical protein ASZ90_020193 [hydrocarbon metagenome]|uniref:Uncharacterized protein n=1 Tax=hydrocarbon metagenome TaxID=938273 RepID=A0A0W8E1B9_9ZZZZ